MLMLRLVLMLALAAMFVLLGAYLGTRDKKYLTYLMNAIKYLGYFLAAMLVLFILSRVIR
ncbi:MAG: hypothetical protein H7Z20_10210 [Bdellovibrio sp.]|nr:hypothetical protein [Methylotenera sp.]